MQSPELIEALRKAILDEIGGHEAALSCMQGACEALLSRVHSVLDEDAERKNASELKKRVQDLEYCVGELKTETRLRLDRLENERH